MTYCCTSSAGDKVAGFTNWFENRRFISLPATVVCVGVARNGVTHSTVLFLLPFPSFDQVRAVT
jgi:hypothetical protein